MELTEHDIKRILGDQLQAVADANKKRDNGGINKR